MVKGPKHKMDCMDYPLNPPDLVDLHEGTINIHVEFLGHAN